MNVALWTVQIVLAVLFAAAGGLKVLTRGPKHFAAPFQFVDVLIGIAEVAGAVGLVVPGAFSVLQVLTPMAATCLTTLMVGALAFHLARRDPPQQSGVTVALAALSGFVAYGRFTF
jgi:hypothetical protein